MFQWQVEKLSPDKQHSFEQNCCSYELSLSMYTSLCYEFKSKDNGKHFFLYSSDFPQEFFFSLGVLDFCGFLHRKKIEKHKYISQKVHFNT